MSAAYVEPSWLSEHLHDADVRIVDTRSLPYGQRSTEQPGKVKYGAGHIAGAIYLDYAADLSDPTTAYAARVAPAERFAEVMAASGIGDDTFVVAYDDGKTPFAARLYWMLRFYGHERVAILAGGLPAWTATGAALSTDVPVYPRATFTPREQPGLRATKDDVLAATNAASAVQLVETQAEKTYQQRDVGYTRSTRLSIDDLLDASGKVLDRAALEARIAQAGLDRTAPTIVACGSGVAASGAYVAFAEAGFTNVAVYDGSWAEWKHLKLPTAPKSSHHGRLPWYEPADVSPEQRPLYDTIVARSATAPVPFVDDRGRLQGPFNALLVNPIVGEAMHALGAAVRASGRITPRMREIAILDISRLRQCEFEWYAHDAGAQQLGVSEDDIADIYLGEIPASFGADERTLLEVVRAIMASGAIDDGLYARALAVFDQPTLAEIIALCGYYDVLARMMRVWQTPLPPNVGAVFAT